MWEIIIAAYASGVGMALWKLWIPALREIKRIAPYSVIARQWIWASIIVMILFTICLPIIIYAFLFDEQADRFIKSFVYGATTEDERQ
tara:strand:- start:516 stop:779 length:264 start_codon:yes stop_codon:yes gene_type:complete